jgi:GNAT superfamily N-acetyltransferase
MPEPRPIDPERDDMAALLSLILAAFAGMEGRIHPPSSTRSLTPETLREKARLESGFVIEAEGRPVACLFCRAERDCLYLGKLAVDPAWQGKGLGRRLLAEAEALAGSLGLKRLRLETRVELTENHAVFGRWGFVRVGEHSHAGFGRVTSIEMAKELP